MMPCLSTCCDDRYRRVMVLGVNLTRPQYLALWSSMSLDVSVEGIIQMTLMLSHQVFSKADYSHNVDRPHPISLRLQEEKSGHQLRKKIPPCRLPLDLNCSINSSLGLCPAGLPFSFGLAILHNNMSQFLKINLSPPLSIHVYTLLILFLWRTLTRFPSFLPSFLSTVCLSCIYSSYKNKEFGKVSFIIYVLGP